MNNIPIRCDYDTTIIIENTTLGMIWNMLSDIDNMPWQLKQKIFGYNTLTEVIRNMKPHNVVEKYYTWKDNESHNFHRGDQVRDTDNGDISWVTYVYEDKVYCLSEYGLIHEYSKKQIAKTGKFNKTLADMLFNGIENYCNIEEGE